MKAFVVTVVFLSSNAFAVSFVARCMTPIVVARHCKPIVRIRESVSRAGRLCMIPEVLSAKQSALDACAEVYDGSKQGDARSLRLDRLRVHSVLKHLASCFDREYKGDPVQSNRMEYALQWMQCVPLAGDRAVSRSFYLVSLLLVAEAQVTDDVNQRSILQQMRFEAASEANTIAKEAVACFSIEKDKALKDGSRVVLLRAVADAAIAAADASVHCSLESLDEETCESLLKNRRHASSAVRSAAHAAQAACLAYEALHF